MSRRPWSTSMKETRLPSRLGVRQMSLTSPNEKVALPAPITAILTGLPMPVLLAASFPRCLLTPTRRAAVPLRASREAVERRCVLEVDLARQLVRQRHREGIVRLVGVPVWVVAGNQDVIYQVAELVQQLKELVGP